MEDHCIVSQQVLGFDSQLGKSLSVWRLHVLCVFVWVSSGCSGCSHPQEQVSLHCARSHCILLCLGVGDPGPCSWSYSCVIPICLHIRSDGTSHQTGASQISTSITRLLTCPLPPHWTSTTAPSPSIRCLQTAGIPAYMETPGPVK